MTIRMTGSNNPFFGKRHKPETIELLKRQDKSYTKTVEFSQRVKDSMVGIDTSVNLVGMWTEKYGKEEAQHLETSRRQKISKTMSGEGNPMFGRPAPLASGGGVKGWYGTHFFRSLRELSYMLELDSNGNKWKSAETAEYKISYVNPYTGNAATYHPDFIVNDVRMIECKPVNFHGTVIVKCKEAAARVFCESRGFTYELIDVPVISWKVLFELEQSGAVKLTERTRMKLNAYDHNFERFARRGKIDVCSRSLEEGIWSIQEDQP
jgi:hypothetical protein